MNEAPSNNKAVATKLTEASYKCEIYSQPSGVKYHSFVVQRFGDTCPPGSTYNTGTGLCDYSVCPLGQERDATGVCVAKACTQDSSGDPIVFSPSQNKCTKYYNLQDQEACSFLSGKPSHQEQEYFSNDPSGASQITDPASKCGMNMTEGKCTTKTNGLHKCVGRGVYDGTFNPEGTKNIPNTCPNGQTDCTQKPPEEPPPPDPKPEKTQESKPCVYAPSGDGLACQSTQKTETEGTKSCGTVNGVYTCVPKAPTSNGIIIDTKVTTTTNADGSTTTTKTDTATQTTCTNIGKCTTGTTTNTTTTIKDANGNTTSTSGSCKGDNCPDENTNPDGNGDGFGDCVGDDCGEGSGGTAPGDAELEEVATFGESAGNFLSRVEGAPIPRALHNLRAPSSGNCPTYATDLGQYGTLKYDSHCVIIEEKRTLISLIAKTLWALLALWIVVG
jgi:hypothetical protein